MGRRGDWQAKAGRQGVAGMRPMMLPDLAHSIPAHHFAPPRVIRQPRLNTAPWVGGPQSISSGPTSNATKV
jgi:hypothetical protein